MKLKRSDITALVPAHDEADNIAATIASLKEQGIRDIVVVCDNCTDETAAIAEREDAYAMNTEGNTARKAGALNQGIEFLSGGQARLVLAMDADTILQPGWVDEALRVLNGQPGVGAVGAIFEADRGDGWLRRCQALEWHRFARECDRTGKTFVLSGTAALIRWEALEDVWERSGCYYDEQAITEDFRLTTDLLACGWKLRSPDACRTTTETMPTVPDLFRQRRRWSLGALQVVKRQGIRPRFMWVYAYQQFMLLLSIFAMSLLMALTVAALAAGALTLSPFWACIGLIFAAERVITVWGRPWRDRIFAGLVLPELIYAMIIQAAHLAALYQFVTGSNGSWHHVKKD